MQRKMRDCDPDYFSYIDIRDTSYLYHLVHVIGSGGIFKEALVAEVVNRSDHPVAGSVHGVPAVGHVDVGVWPIVGVEQAPGKRCHRESLVSDWSPGHGSRWSVADIPGGEAGAEHHVPENPTRVLNVQEG